MHKLEREKAVKGSSVAIIEKTYVLRLFLSPYA